MPQVALSYLWQTKANVSSYFCCNPLVVTNTETAKRAQTTLTDGTRKKDEWGKVAGMSYVSSGMCRVFTRVADHSDLKIPL